MECCDSGTLIWAAGGKRSMATVFLHSPLDQLQMGTQWEAGGGSLVLRLLGPALACPFIRPTATLATPGDPLPPSPPQCRAISRATVFENVSGCQDAKGESW